MLMTGGRPSVLSFHFHTQAQPIKTEFTSISSLITVFLAVSVVVVALFGSHAGVITCELIFHFARISFAGCSVGLLV